MSPFWAWVTDHWFLSFILAMVVLKIVSRTLRTILAPLERLAPQKDEEEPPSATPESNDESEEEAAESDEKEVQGVVLPIRPRTRFDRV